MTTINLDHVEDFKKRTEALTAQFENYFKVCRKIDPAFGHTQVLEAFVLQQIAGLQLGMDHLLKLVEDSLAQKEKTKLEIVK